MTTNMPAQEFCTMSSGSLAFDLLEHNVAAETLLTLHANITAALARNPCAEIQSLLNDIRRHLTQTFDTMQRILDAHEPSYRTLTQRETIIAWRATIERMRRRILTPHAASVPHPIYVGWSEHPRHKDEQVYFLPRP